MHFKSIDLAPVSKKKKKTIPNPIGQAGGAFTLETSGSSVTTVQKAAQKQAALVYLSCFSWLGLYFCYVLFIVIDIKAVYSNIVKPLLHWHPLKKKGLWSPFPHTARTGSVSFKPRQSLFKTSNKSYSYKTSVMSLGGHLWNASRACSAAPISLNGEHQILQNCSLSLRLIFIFEITKGNLSTTVS